MVEIGPNLLAAILALCTVVGTIITYLRQQRTESRVEGNTARLNNHAQAINEIQDRVNGGRKP